MSPREVLTSILSTLVPPDFTLARTELSSTLSIHWPSSLKSVYSLEKITINKQYSSRDSSRKYGLTSICFNLL